MHQCVRHKNTNLAPILTVLTKKTLNDLIDFNIGIQEAIDIAIYLKITLPKYQFFAHV